MKRNRFPEERIIAILKDAEAGAVVTEPRATTTIGLWSRLDGCWGSRHAR